MRRQAGSEGRTVIVWIALVVIFLVVYQSGDAIVPLVVGPAVFALGAGMTLVRLQGRMPERPLRLMGIVSAPWMIGVVGVTAYVAGVMAAAIVGASCAGLVAIPMVWIWRQRRGFQHLERALDQGTVTEADVAKAPQHGMWLFSVVVLLMRHQRNREAVRVLEASPAPGPYPSGRAFWLLEGRLRLGDRRGADAAMSMLEEAGDPVLVELGKSRLEVLDGKASEALARIDRLGEPKVPAVGLLQMFGRADALASIGRRDEARTEVARMIERGGKGLAQDLIGSGRPAAALAEELAAGGGQPFR